MLLVKSERTCLASCYCSQFRIKRNDVSPELPVNLGYNYIRTHANMGQVSRTSQKQ